MKKKEKKTVKHKKTKIKLNEIQKIRWNSETQRNINKTQWNAKKYNKAEKHKETKIKLNEMQRNTIKQRNTKKQK